MYTDLFWWNTASIKSCYTYTSLSADHTDRHATAHTALCRWQKHTCTNFSPAVSHCSQTPFWCVSPTLTPKPSAQARLIRILTQTHTLVIRAGSASRGISQWLSAGSESVQQGFHIVTCPQTPISIPAHLTSFAFPKLYWTGKPRKQEQTYPTRARICASLPSGVSSAYSRCSSRSGCMWQQNKKLQERVPVSRCCAQLSSLQVRWVHHLLGLTQMWWIFTPLKHDSESPSSTHQKTTRHHGVITLPEQRLHHVLFPLPLLTPHMMYQIWGLERGGKWMWKRTGIPQEWTTGP